MSKRDPAAYAIPRFSVTHPVSVLMILLTILVVGFIAYTRMPIALYPEGMETNQLYILASYPNASPRDIEEKITRKIEDIIGTVPNVKRINSYSYSGGSQVRVEFQTGTKLRDAYAMLSDRMDRVKPTLPSDVDRITVRRYDQNDSPMMNLVAILPPNMEDAAYRLENYVKPALQRIEGVGNVDIRGVQTREVQVQLSDERLRSHGIDVSAMASSLSSQNFTLSGGYVVEGGQKIYVRSMGRFTSVGEISELIVDRTQRLRLRDIADVSLRMPQRDQIYRVDRQPAVGLAITRDATGNIERISREVRATLGSLSQVPQLKGVRFEIFNDQGTTVRAALKNLSDSGWWGGAFAALVIFTFLRAVRMTGILTLAIPLSLLCALIVLYFMHWSMNMATMMGLLLAVGMVVDNAIVIVENIYRLRQEGTEATRASIVGAGEVGLAVVMSTLTSIVVFLPLMLMGQSGDMAFWLLRIGVPVIASLLASLFIALVFVPVAAQRLSRGKHHAELRAVAWLRERYLSSLNWVLHHRLDAAIIVIVLGWSTWQFSNSHRLSRQGSMNISSGSSSENTMWMYFELPSGGTIEQADEFFSRVETTLAANATRYDVERMESRIGYNFGQVQLKLRDDPKTQWYEFAWDSLQHTDTVKTVLGWLGVKPPPPKMTRDEIEADFREKFPTPPGIVMSGRLRGSTAPQDAGTSIALYGEDTTVLLSLAEEAVRRLRTIPGITSAETDLARGGQELRIQLDRDRARTLGINPSTISGNIGSAMRGQELGRYYVNDGRELRVYAQVGEADRQRVDDVRSMTFKTESGVDVPLESVAELSVARTLGQIQREARQTILRIIVRAPRADAAALFAAVDQAMTGFEMPRGYRWDKGNYFSQQSDNEKQMKYAIWMASVFVFLLMGLLFESFILPFAVIVTVPFSFMGVYWILYLTNTPYERMAMIGSVILIGVVVNNAIVLIDMTNRLRAEGKARLESLLEAGRNRFRPIAMTTLTTVFGLVPMAMGNSKMIGIPYAPLGRTMIGGLVVSTLLTLVVVPLFYTFLDDLRGYVMRIFQTAWTKRSPGTVLPAAPSGGGAAGVGRAGRVE